MSDSKYPITPARRRNLRLAARPGASSPDPFKSEVPLHDCKNAVVRETFASCVRYGARDGGVGQ